VLKCGLELATIAHRDRFALQPVPAIRQSAERLENLANFVIQDISDPMVLQPASLNLVTLKKRESELGFNIESSYNGIHRVTDIKYNSPAHNSGKIEDGDEIVQINYQTVVGWQHRTVLEHLREALPDVVLTVKKRPKHTKMFGQIYMQPYRLPSKKRNMAARWAAQMPSPRAAFLTLDTEQLATGGTGSAVPDPSKSLSSEKREVLTKANPVSSASDSDSSCSDIPTPTDPKLAAREIRLYYPKPRALLQRRNTICGCEYLSLKNSDLVVPSWHERKPGIGSPTNCDPGSPSIRDKSISFGYGLEMAARPTTCIGIAGDTSTDKARRMFHEARKLKQLTEDSQREFLVDRYKPGVSKVVRFDAKEDYVMKNEKFICNVENTILETFEPIPFADEGDEDALETLRNCKTENAEELLEAINLATKGQDLPLAEAINMPLLQQGRRGRLDKSHSTPAYDNSGEESDTPPAIEPRKEFLLVTPPAPPPRPRKQREMTPPAVPPPPPKPASMQPASSITSISIPVPVPVPAAVDPSEISELHTPSKSRTLTLKKKHSLMAKRRNTNLKLLGTGDIQGHLYRRKKNHRGVTYWARIYFVMLDTILYGFRSKQSTSASLVIFLPGFTVSLAKEVHSKPHAFKVYHTAKSFYFAAESLDALNQWVDFLRQASLKVPPSTGSKGGGDAKDLYSENDSSGEECDALVIQNLSTPSPQGNKESMSMSMTLSGGTPPSSAPIKHERGYLDSFRKFTNTFKSSAAKPSSDIPVPTEQYRSYRKVPGGSFGIQIGANTPGYHDPAMPPTQIPPLVGPKLSRSSSRSSVVSGTESAVSLSASILGPPASPAPTPTPTATPTSLQHQSSEESPSQSQSQSPSSKSSLKKAPFNFLHASNPNLVEFDFHTSKTLLPKMSVGNTLDHGHNIQGFVTLKDLMLRKQEEEAQEMYNNRVHLGVEKHKHARTESTASQQSAMSSSVTKPLEKLPKIQSVSLPKTPDYEISFKPDDESIKRTRTKEGQKLRDFGYELICGDEPSTSSISRQEHHHHHHHHQHHLQHVQQQQQLQHQQTQQQHSSKAKHFLRSQQLQLSSFLHKNSSGGSGKSSGSGADQKKSKGKSSGDRRFPFSKHSTGSTGSGCGPGHAMTMTLPLNKKSKSNHALDGAVGNGVTIIGSGSSIKKSQTYNQDLRDKIVGTKYDAHRKNSAPIPIFSKLSISGGTPAKPSKENRFLGSPLLHRTLFGHHHHQQQAVTPPSSADPDCDQEIFSQITLPTHNQAGYRSYRGPGILTTSTTNLCSSEGLQPPLPPAPPPPVNASRQREEEQAEATISECAATPKVSSSGSVDSKAATPDYPNMECPPVFEPEIYSLSDTSLSRIVMRTPSSSGATSATASTTTTNNNNNNNNTNNNTNTNSSPSGGEHHQT